MPRIGKHKSAATYNYGAMILHWVIALLILVQLVGGFLMIRYSAMPMPTRLTFYQVHKTVGIGILLLTLMRIVWRIVYKPPQSLPLKPWEKGIEHLVTFLFYALLLIVPLFGWAVVSASPTPIPTYLFGNAHLLWPALPLTPGADLFNQMEWVHIILSYSFILLIGLHIGGALKHQFYDKTAELRRMIPMGKQSFRPRAIALFFALLALMLCMAALALLR